MTTYLKTLRPFKKMFTKKHVQQSYPYLVEFIDQFLLFMESRNYTEWFPVADSDSLTDSETTEQRDNSLYMNISDMIKFGNIEDIPIKNKKLLYAYFLNYAAGFNLDSYLLELQEDENVRAFIKYANIMSRMKGTHKAFSFFINLIRNHKINNANKTIQLEEYYIDSDSTTNPPTLSYINSNTDKVILTDVPCYYVDANNDIQKTTLTEADKGNFPFKFQIISASDIFKDSTFIQNFRENIQPAGWSVDIYVPLETLEGCGYEGVFSADADHKTDINTVTKAIVNYEWNLSNVNKT